MVGPEAVIRSVPVIASSTGGFAETIEDEVSGLLFPNGDELALHRALERVATGTAFPSHLLDPEVVARTTQSFSNVTSPIFPRTCTMSLTGHCRARQCRVEFSMALVDLHQQHWKKCERSENILRGYFGTFYAASGKDGRSGEI